MSKYFEISTRTFTKIAQNVNILLYCNINTISMEELQGYNIMGDVYFGAVDGSTHKKNRTHPGSSSWYRYDKGFHFMGVQSHGIFFIIKNSKFGRFKNSSTFFSSWP